MKKFQLVVQDSIHTSFQISGKGILNSQMVQSIPSSSHLQTNKKFMKNIQFLNKTVLLLIVSLFFTIGTISAQVINEGFEESVWSNFGTGTGKSSNGTVVLPNTPNTSTMSYLTSTSNFTTALNTCNNSGTWYYSKATTGSGTKYGSGANSKSHSIKISSGGYIITPLTPGAVVNVTFWAANSSGTIVTGLATDQNFNVPIYNVKSSNAIGAFSYATSTYPKGNGSMQSYSFGGQFSGPSSFGIFCPSGAIIDDIQIFQPSGTPPTISTGSATANINTASLSGSVSPGTLPLAYSGIIWSTASLSGTSVDTAFQTKTTDIPAATSSFIDQATSLLPNTTYNYEAYVIGSDGSLVVGAIKQFTTLPAIAPSLTTTPASNILSNKATSGGVIINEGGALITRVGICWSTDSTKLSASSGSNFIDVVPIGDNFNSVIKPLLPQTKYYIKAYAQSSAGLSYGNLDSLITTNPVAVITASKDTLTFQPVTVNSAPKILSDTIKGVYLSPASGTVTIAISDTNFLISTSKDGSFSDSVVVPYSNGTFNAVIYIMQVTSNYASNTSTLSFSIPGVTNLNSDNVVLIDNVIPDPNVLTNLGTEFWVGHGLEEHMGSKNAYGLQLYIATGAQSATVKVSVPGFPLFATFPQSYTIPPNSVQIVSGFPVGDGTANNKSGAPDARLYYTGISNRAIHVEVTNNVPVAVFLYDYATNNSAGGSMVFPTNTWNSSYIVQTYGGAPTNTGVPNTYFFVMAKEDNTKVIFKPTAQILDSASSPIITGSKVLGSRIAYDINTSDTIILNKGQVFNAVGMVDPASKVSYDLTGTIVSSDCSHPIAVFAGNSRTLINAPDTNCFPTSGSDNLIQQMFPKVAWGTKYLTVPTKTMEYNLFRIGVGDTTTVVTIDDSILDRSKLNKTGLFYEFEGNTCKKIQSNKPITVTQFILPGSACGGATIGNSGTGDPEMILLSPVQQSIKSTTVYASDFKDRASGGAYINVVIPTSGVSSFRLDIDTVNNPLQYVDTGASSYPDTLGISHAYAPADTLIPIANAFKPFPQDPSYSWAKFHVSYPGIHTMSASVGFNAIAYGVANGESWGYNAGTKIVDLTTHISTNTPYGHSQDSLAGTTCKGNTTSINISLPYDSSTVQSMEWKSDNDPSITPANFDTSINKPVAIDHFVQAGVTYYTYKSPITYTFDSLGTFNFTVTVYGTFANDCGGSQTIKVPMIIGKDITNFKTYPINCGDSTYYFKNTTNTFSSARDSMVIWSFPTLSDTVFSNIKKRGDTTYTFPFTASTNPSNRTVKLRSINTIGCFSDTVKTFPVLIAPKPVAAFSVKDSICISNAESFTNNTDINYTAKYGKSPTYLWKFGDGSATNTTTNPAYQYSVAKTYTATLTATSAAGCDSTISHVITVVSPPPPSHITSISTNTTNSILIGEQISLSDNISKGIWGNTNTRVAAMDSSANIAKVTGLSKGLDTIYYIQPARICSSDTAIYPIKVEPSIVFMPNLFTPDGDGHNDIFYVRGSTTLYKEVEIFVFNSWGTQVFHRKGLIENPSDGWDGNYNGKAQPSGVYVWVAKLTGWNGNIITEKGSVTLLR